MTAGAAARCRLRHSTKMIETFPFRSRDCLILPGFIDCHVHYPQTEMVAAYGEQLLEWLENYTFPTEREFSDPDKARQVAELFLDELLRNGTTTALAIATVHKTSVDAFFIVGLGTDTGILALRLERCKHLADKLFVMAILGIIHSPGLHWPQLNGIVAGYLFVGLGILIYSTLTTVQRLAAPEDPMDSDDFPAATKVESTP